MKIINIALIGLSLFGGVTLSNGNVMNFTINEENTLTEAVNTHSEVLSRFDKLVAAETEIIDKTNQSEPSTREQSEEIIKESWQDTVVENRTTEFRPGDIGYNEELIMEEVFKQGGRNRAQVAYILATAKHESANFTTLTEFASGAAYEYRSDLGNIYQGDGTWFKGRGYVQITGRNNYQKYSDILGVDLISNPHLVAENTDVAVYILVDGMFTGHFTGRPLVEFVNDDKTDFYSARQVVNGLDRANHIAALAEDYMTLI